MARVSRMSLCLALVFAAACGGGDSPWSPSDAVPGDVPDVALLDLASEAGETGPRDVDETVLPAHRYLIIVLLDQSAPTPVQIGGSVTIPAEVLDQWNGNAPAIAKAVDLAITATTDISGADATGDANLDGAEVFTDAAGIAHDPFHMGTTAGRRYTVTISTEDADSVTLQLETPDITCSCINVTLNYEGGLPATSLSEVKVHVLPSDYTCDLLHPESPLPTSLGDKTLTGTSSTTTFDCLPANQYYTVFVTAKGPNACVAASGCNDSVFLQPDKCRDATVNLYLVPLNPTGMYTSDDKFDLTNLIKDCAGGITDPLECVAVSGADVGKQVCCVVYQLVTFFQSPATTIIGVIKDAAKQFVGSVIVDTLFSIFESALTNVINDWIFNNSPAWVKDFFNAGQSVMGIVTALELHSDLYINKVQNNFTVTGLNNWTGLTIGGKTFDLKQLQNTQFPLNLVQGTWSGTIENFDHLREDVHTINLNYGKLILFVLDEIVIPQVTSGKAHSIEEAAKLWIDCTAIANQLMNALKGTGVFSGSVQDLTNICNTGLNTLLSPLDALVGSLQLDTYLTLEGGGTLVDVDCDLKVDKIVDGTYTGHLQTPNAQQSAFTGTWSAVKK